MPPRERERERESEREREVLGNERAGYHVGRK
jgi:hypothetical protein